MNTNILSRGFTLTAALHSAVLREIDAYCSRHGNSATSIDVRLFDSNGPRGGARRTMSRIPAGAWSA